MGGRLCCNAVIHKNFMIVDMVQKLTSLRNSILILFLILIIVNCSDDQTLTEPDSIDLPVQEKSIEEIIAEKIDSFSVATGCVGLSVGYLMEDERYYHSKGVLNKTANVPCDENTIYEIASLTKSFTGFLIADLELQNKLSLNDTINLITDLYIPKIYDTEIKVIDLCTHSSGLKSFPGQGSKSTSEILDIYKTYDATLLKNYLTHAVFLFQPGTEFHYSNMGYAILGYTAELNFGQEYETLIKEKICGPLGMEDTRITLNSEQQKRFVTAYNEDGEIVSHWEFKIFAGAAALRSTVKDMLSYVEGNIGVRAPELEERFQMTHRSLRFNYGLGWFVSDYGGNEIIFHDGLTYGSNTYVKFSKTKKIGLVVLSNQSFYYNHDGKNIYTLSNELWRVLNN